MRAGSIPELSSSSKNMAYALCNCDVDKDSHQLRVQKRELASRLYRFSRLLDNQSPLTVHGSGTKAQFNSYLKEFSNLMCATIECEIGIETECWESEEE